MQCQVWLFVSNFQNRVRGKRCSELVWRGNFHCGVQGTCLQACLEPSHGRTSLVNIKTWYRSKLCFIQGFYSIKCRLTRIYLLSTNTIMSREILSI